MGATKQGGGRETCGMLRRPRFLSHSTATGRENWACIFSGETRNVYRGALADGCLPLCYRASELRWLKLCTN